MSAPPPTYSATASHDYTQPPTAGEALPAYDTSSAPQEFVPSPEIDDKIPNHFRINETYSPVLVYPSDLEAHLVLLGAFHRLREDVRTQKGKADIPMQPEERWAVFLQRAVYRFEAWAVRVIGTAVENENSESGVHTLKPDEYPPLDVMMVWHTYMLNPRTYYEDCLRRLRGLLQVGQVAAPLKQRHLLIPNH